MGPDGDDKYRSARYSQPSLPRLLCVALSMLAMTFTMVMLVDAAEFQSVALILVKAQHGAVTTRPMMDVGFKTVLFMSLLPLIIMALALLRGWPLAYFLTWMFVIVLAVSVVAGSIVFASYRYWRDYQPVGPMGVTSISGEPQSK
jgi:hypothetical protein